MLSKPTYTPATMSGVKPTNHTERALFVVPVLPATGLPSSFARCAVPFSTTLFMSDDMMYAVCGENTGTGSAFGISITSPFRRLIFSMSTGGAHCPPFANTVYASTRSSGNTPPVPSANDKFSGNGCASDVKCTFFAMSSTGSTPTFSRIEIEHVLTECVRHSRSVMSPRKRQLLFSGVHFWFVYLSKNTLGASVIKRCACVPPRWRRDIRPR